MPTPRTRTLAIIPALNEEESIGLVLADLRAHNPGIDIVVVDDGSTDATARIALDAGAIVVSLPFNMGIGAALRAGFRYARRHDYDSAFQFDADGQHDATEVGALLAGLADADMVIGSRFTSGSGEYEVGRTRGFAMGILRVVIGLLAGRSFTDTSSGFRAFNRTAIEHFAKTYPREYMDSVEALISAVYGGLRVVEVPAQMRERAGGAPSNRSFKLAYHYIRLLSVLTLTVSRNGRSGKLVRS